MRAVIAHQAGGPEVLRVEDVPEPEPGPGQARIRVAYAVLNPLDTHARSARVAYKASGFPYTPGFEYTGVVDAVGDGVDPALVGTRRTFLGFSGGCAELAIAPVASPYCHLFQVPDDFDWQLAAAFPCITYTAWHVLHTAAGVAAGQTVLFHGGAGNVAVMGAQIATEIGARVIGLCSSDAKIDFARRFSSADLVNRSRVDWVAAVLDLTDGRGADVIVDGVAGPEAPRNLQAAAPFGQVVYLGAIAGSAPPIDVSAQLYAKSLSVRGFLLYVAMALTGGREDAEIHEALREERWRVPIAHVWELDEVAELHRAFEDRRLTGRQLIRVGGDI